MAVPVSPPSRGIAQNGMDFPKITYVFSKWKPFVSIFRVCGWEYFKGRLVDATQQKNNYEANQFSGVWGAAAGTLTYLPGFGPIGPGPTVVTVG